ncbi:MAG: DUF5688 family protein [Lachnospiraceae bacterium]|nr:DUF5688 family protein [Lachnospiraceae bacterium]
MNEISIQTFADTVKQKLLQHLSASYPNLNIHLHQVPKPGGILLTGLSIQAPGSSVAPVFYLDDHYYHYREGTSMDDILCELVQAYEICNHEVPEIDCKSLTDWNYSKPHIVGRFINISGQPGDRYFTTRPVTEMIGTDIGIVYDIDLFSFTGKAFVMPVDFTLMDTWKITVQDLEETARENLPKLRPVFYDTIINMLKDTTDYRRNEQGIMDTSIKEMAASIDIQTFPELPVYVVTNTQRCNGAISITYPGVYEEIRQIFKEDFYILPSSVHECMCVPKSCSSPEELLSVVTEINHTTISKTSFLCDDVFEMKNGQLAPALSPDERNQALLHNVPL